MDKKIILSILITLVSISVFSDDKLLSISKTNYSNSYVVDKVVNTNMSENSIHIHDKYLIKINSSLRKGKIIESFSLYKVDTSEYLTENKYIDSIIKNKINIEYYVDENGKFLDFVDHEVISKIYMPFLGNDVSYKTSYECLIDEFDYLFEIKGLYGLIFNYNEPIEGEETIYAPIVNIPVKMEYQVGVYDVDDSNYQFYYKSSLNKSQANVLLGKIKEKFKDSIGSRTKNSLITPVIEIEKSLYMDKDMNIFSYDSSQTFNYLNIAIYKVVKIVKDE